MPVLSKQNHHFTPRVFVMFKPGYNWHPMPWQQRATPRSCEVSKLEDPKRPKRVVGGFSRLY